MREVAKAWGKEVIFADSDLYAGKLLVFDEIDARFSLHYHKDKTETWYVLSGCFTLETVDLKTGIHVVQTLNVGDTWTNKPFEPHRLTCESACGTVIEVSTADSAEDNYRIEPGDSQK